MMDLCGECGGQGAIIIDISKGIVIPRPVCERKSKIKVVTEKTSKCGKSVKL